ncbi:MAG: alpha-E domain-containing protein [Ilumatobacteraceae bacterium]
MSVLLARVAEDLYWSARYLERADVTARIIKEYTNLLVDLPREVMSSWRPLLAIVGTAEELAGEQEIMEFLIAADDHPGSIAECIRLARENLRRCREIIPLDAWFVVNDLHLYTVSNAGDGLSRRGRIRFLDRISAEHQRLVGILAGTMLRDEAYSMTRLGRHLERADMTTRVLDVRASALSPDRPEHERAYDALQWSSVLRTLAASQMFHRTHRQPVNGEAVTRFALHEPRLPRSVTYCLSAARDEVQRLPAPDRAVAACDRALRTLAAIDPTANPISLHDQADRLQHAIGEVHASLTETYFRGPDGAS